MLLVPQSHSVVPSQIQQMSRNSFIGLENLREDGGFQIEEFIWDNKPRIHVGTIENFQDEPKIAAKRVSFMGEKCLDFIKSNPVFQEKYRIELSPEEGLWKLYLHLDPVAWFDALMSRPNETRGSVIKKARECVNNVRETYYPSRPENFIYDPILSKSYCNHHGECVRCEYFIDIMQILNANAETNRNSITINKSCPWFIETPKIYCQAESPQQRRQSRSCNWYAEQERIIPFDERLKMPLGDYSLKQTDEWIVISRLEHVRELLVFPTKHKTNKDLIKSEEFWAWVLDNLVKNFLGAFCSRGYPLNSFAMNFGTWESELAKDKNAVDCHGHLHLCLKLDVVRKMVYKYLGIRGKVNDPYHYGLLDCK
ncbi:3469_t:CDS:2 [Funneliformis mosseae]|uniref:3469_t:CDS:1 n=1 Tax=Funneliformis mosseae TaxID=27381 RepID=A0A9N9GKG1_FUNMO|nr:3469_t:CDS:2 [Funneliformis mosseae]